MAYGAILGLETSGTSGGAASESTPVAFSLEASEWITLSTAFAGCGYSAEIAAEGVSMVDYPDVFFDLESIETATEAGIIAGTADNKVVLYARSIPTDVLSGAYFIRKGVSK